MKIKNPDHPYAPKFPNQWRYLDLQPGRGLLIYKRRIAGMSTRIPNFHGWFKVHRDIIKGSRIVFIGWSGRRYGELFINLTVDDNFAKESRERYLIRKRYAKKLLETEKELAKTQKELAERKAKERREAPRELRRTDTL